MRNLLFITLLLLAACQPAGDKPTREYQRLTIRRGNGAHRTHKTAESALARH